MNFILKLFKSNWHYKWGFGFYKDMPDKAFKCYYDVYVPVATLFVSKRNRCKACAFSETTAFCDMNKANKNIPPCTKELRGDKYDVFFMSSGL